jgi:nitroreductase
MEALEAILTRRSIRKYTDKAVPKEAVEKLLEAAMSAPSAMNSQPWEFVVIRDRAKLLALRDAHPYAQMLTEARLAVAVCGVLARESYPGYWMIDCSAATQNLLLAAHALGLGAVWLGVHPRPERIEPISRLLELPEGVIPLALVAVGYPAERKEPSRRFESGRIHFEHW